MKKSRVWILVLMICIASLILSGCGEKSGVKKTINNFENACNSADIEAALDCLTPAASNAARLALSVVGIDDINAGFAKLLEVVGFIDFNTDQPIEVLKSVSIKEKDMVFNDNKDSCTADTTIQYEIDGEKKEADLTFKLKCEDGTWYITMIY